MVPSGRLFRRRRFEVGDQGVLFACAFQKATASLGATDQEIAEAAAMAGYVRNWSAVLYGTGADVAAHHAMVDGLYPGQ